MIKYLKPAQLKRLIVPSALVLLSAIMLSLCFPGMGDMGGWVFVWPFPFLFCLFSLSNKRTLVKGFSLGYLCGLGFWLLNLKWLLRMADLDFVPLGGAVFAWLLLPAYLAFYFGIFGALVAKWGNPWQTKQPKQFKTRIDEKIAAKQQQKQSSNKLFQSFKDSTNSLRFALMHASLWTILEWVRSIFFTGFSWNGLGVAFYDIPVLAQSAELVGVIGLSFVPMFVASIFFQVIFRMAKEIREGRLKPHFDLAVAGLLIAAMFGFGVSRLFSLSSAITKDVGFIIIQQNLSLNQKHGNSSHIGNMSDYAEDSLEELQKIEDSNKKKFEAYQNNPDAQNKVSLDHVDFIIWPESTLLRGVSINKETQIPYFTEVEQIAIQRVIHEGSHGLLTGANEYHFVNQEEIYMANPPAESYNSISLFRARPEESILENIYKKNHLVIFGEYIPYRDTLPILEQIVGASHGTSLGPNYSSGNNTEPMKTIHNNEELQLIGSVCFEDTVGRLTRHSVRDADQVIVNVTNDGWFGDSEEPKQHFANALFRTIELRRPMVRSANTGISCIINVKGSIENSDGSLNAVVNDQGKCFTEGNLHAYAQVLKSAPITLYAIAGDWFIVVCGVIYLITLVSSFRQRAA